MPKRPWAPFRPGPGRSPPYLAGREAEQKLFHDLFSGLESGLAPPSEIPIYGPRGNGKTALLIWLREEAAPGFDLDLLLLARSAAEEGGWLGQFGNFGRLATPPHLGGQVSGLAATRNPG